MEKSIHENPTKATATQTVSMAEALGIAPQLKAKAVDTAVAKLAKYLGIEVDTLPTEIANRLNALQENISAVICVSTAEFAAEGLNTENAVYLGEGKAKVCHPQLDGLLRFKKNRKNVERIARYMDEHFGYSMSKAEEVALLNASGLDQLSNVKFSFDNSRSRVLAYKDTAGSIVYGATDGNAFVVYVPFNHLPESGHIGVANIFVVGFPYAEKFIAPKIAKATGLDEETAKAVAAMVPHDKRNIRKLEFFANIFHDSRKYNDMLVKKYTEAQSIGSHVPGWKYALAYHMNGGTLCDVNEEFGFINMELAPLSAVEISGVVYIYIAGDE